MKYKKCFDCKETKVLDDFYKNKNKKDGLQSRCKSCHKIVSKINWEKYIANNPGWHKIHNAKHREVYKKTRTDKHDKIIDILSKSRCKDCGISDIRCLEFDHVVGIKRNDVSVLLSNGVSWGVVEDEIAKCDIVCANCHRIRTIMRSKNYKSNHYNNNCLNI